MTSTLDINLLPLAFLGGQEQMSMPGLHIATPSRRPARGRQSDRLILYFTATGSAQLSPSSQEQVLGKLGLIYYKTPGSVTSAMRSVAESLNALLLERNVRSSGSDSQATGVLCQAVVRDDSLYIGISGPAHAYILSSTGVKHFHEPPDINRVLGVSKAVTIRYYHSPLTTSDTLLLVYQPPLHWTNTLLESLYGQGPESLRRRLAGFAGADFNAALMQVRSGSGKTFLLKPKPGGSPARPLETGAEAPADFAEKPAAIPGEMPQPAYSSGYGLPTAEVIHAESEPSEESVILEGEPGVPEISQYQPGRTAGESGGVFDSSQTELPASAPFSGECAEAREGQKPQPAKPPIEKVGASLLLKIDQSIHRFSSAVRSSFRQMVPEELLPSVSPAVLAVIAVVVPLIVVAIATLIYFRSGRQSQYQLYLKEAEQLASQAGAQINVLAGREQWEQVLSNLDKAGKYGASAEAQNLRNQALTALDEADGIIRLDFQNAISGGFPSTVQISRMAASNTELFVLDAKSGSILRVFSTASGYEHDDDFKCGPQYPGAEGTGSLIDFALFTRGSQGTTILLGMDAKGNLLQCSAGNSPEKLKLQPPPTSLGVLRGFTLDQGNFYLLDPDKNAVWIYWKSNFENEPELFFGESVPQMKDVIDLAVNQDDLYLLHSDGHLTLCTYSNLSVSPTHCESPVPFVDSRPGRENRILIPETPVTQIYASDPPDPSLYFMEPGRQAIYHFSLRSLTFHRQFRPSSDLINETGGALPASAFAISTDGRVVFLALSNQVYYAAMP